MPKDLDPVITKLLTKDRQQLSETTLPIVTVSASFKEDLKGLYGFAQDQTIPDIVFSRAHYSMAVALAVAAWGKHFNPNKAWIVDPTNYVSRREWKKLELTQSIGQTIARHPFLKMVKDFIDRFGRQKLPILASITPPLLHLTERVKGPILSVHIAAGNILVEQGKEVIQVITDPHVRDDYLLNADSSKIIYAVFDERTKMEFLEKAAARGHKVSPLKVVVTGPPVDPRVVAYRHHKKPWTKGPLKLCLTTGGLGTNKDELENLLEQLLPAIKEDKTKYHVVLYAGTQHDIYQMARQAAKKAKLKVGALKDTKSPFRIIYHPQIVDANELLIKYGFPWADGFISKPSGDMAYDAAAAGCFLLTLAEWGEWEHNIRNVFEQREIGRMAVTDNILSQLDVLTQVEVPDPAKPHHAKQPWVSRAMCNALSIDPLFLSGSENIVELATFLRRKNTSI
jgi:hypothetical protein